MTKSMPRLLSGTRSCQTKTACKHCLCQGHEICVSSAHLSSARVNTLPTVMTGKMPESPHFLSITQLKVKSGLELLLDEGAEAFAEPGCLAELVLLLLLPASLSEKLVTLTS